MAILLNLVKKSCECGAAHQIAQLNTLPASVLYTVTAGTWPYCHDVIMVDLHRVVLLGL